MEAAEPILLSAESVMVTDDGQVTLSVDDYGLLESAGNIADTKDFVVVDSVININ